MNDVTWEQFKIFFISFYDPPVSDGAKYVVNVDKIR